MASKEQQSLIDGPGKLTVFAHHVKCFLRTLRSRVQLEGVGRSPKKLRDGGLSEAGIQDVKAAKLGAQFGAGKRKRKSQKREKRRPGGEERGPQAGKRETRGMSDSEDRSWRTDGESERGVAKEEEEKVETRIGKKRRP